MDYEDKERTQADMMSLRIKQQDQEDVGAEGRKVAALGWQTWRRRAQVRPTQAWLRWFEGEDRALDRRRRPGDETKSDTGRWLAPSGPGMRLARWLSVGAAELVWEGLGRGLARGGRLGEEGIRRASGKSAPELPTSQRGFRPDGAPRAHSASCTPRPRQMLPEISSHPPRASPRPRFCPPSPSPSPAKMNPAASTPVSPRTSADTGDAPKPHLKAAPAQVHLPPLDQSPAPARPQDHPLPTPSSSDPGQPLKPNACISCQRRKVKCDRLEPCSSCKRYRAQCEFRDPAPRRKRKLSDEDLHAKLDRYESILNSFGARVDARSDPASAERPASAALPTPVSAFTPLNAPRPPQPYQNASATVSHEPAPVRPATASGPHTFEGRLIYEKGNSRYLENSLWKGISEEFKSPGDMLRLSSPATTPGGPASLDPYQLEASELVLGLVRNPSGGLRHFHPQSPHIFLLWQAFLDNVNPITKILHAPTVQRQILKAASNLDTVDPETEVLMFAIYTFATTSLPPDECQSSFGESKETLIRKFQFATKLALHRAGFLRSSQLVVLQAYMLYLVSTQVFIFLFSSMNSRS